jgi:hypothetical protein
VVEISAAAPPFPPGTQVKLNEGDVAARVAAAEERIKALSAKQSAAGREAAVQAQLLEK